MNANLFQKTVDGNAAAPHSKTSYQQSSLEKRSMSIEDTMFFGSVTLN